MPYELLNELKYRINKGSSDLKARIPIIDRVINSSVLGNLLPHDNFLYPKIGDLNAFWMEVKELEKLFHFQEATCTTPQVSSKNYESVEKVMRCGCGKTKF